MKIVKERFSGSFIHYFLFCAIGDANTLQIIMMFLYDNVTMKTENGVVLLSLTYIPFAILVYSCFTLFFYVWVFIVHFLFVGSWLSFSEYFKFKMNDIYGYFHVFGYLYLATWVFPIPVKDFYNPITISMFSMALLVYEWWMIVSLVMLSREKKQLKVQ